MQIKPAVVEFNLAAQTGTIWYNNYSPPKVMRMLRGGQARELPGFTLSLPWTSPTAVLQPVPARRFPAQPRLYRLAAFSAPMVSSLTHSI